MNAASEPAPSERRRMLPETWRRPVLGVVGGMGPAATVTFLDALLRATPAGRDQDHIDSVVLNHSSTPDRTARLQDDSAPDPRAYLMGDLELLGRLGADLAVIVCNTAHAFLPEELPVPLLSLIEAGARAALDAAAAEMDGAAETAVPRVMLLATDGTRGSGLYQRALEGVGAEVMLPSAQGQEAVMGMIYDGVKAGVDVPTVEFLDLVQRLKGDADAVLLGCTELSVLAEQAGGELPADVIDAQAALVAEVLASLTDR